MKALKRIACAALVGAMAVCLLAGCSKDTVKTITLMQSGGTLPQTTSMDESEYNKVAAALNAQMDDDNGWNDDEFATGGDYPLDQYAASVAAKYYFAGFHDSDYHEEEAYDDYFAKADYEVICEELEASIKSNNNCTVEETITAYCDTADAALELLASRYANAKEKYNACNEPLVGIGKFEGEHGVVYTAVIFDWNED